MYEICNFLAATTPKVKKARKPAAKAAKIGARVILQMNGPEFTLIERDTRYSSAWFLIDAEGNRLPHSYARNHFTVV